MITFVVPSRVRPCGAGTMFGTAATRTPGSGIRCRYTSASASVVVTTASSER